MDPAYAVRRGASLLALAAALQIVFIAPSSLWFVWSVAGDALWILVQIVGLCLPLAAGIWGFLLVRRGSRWMKQDETARLGLATIAFLASWVLGLGLVVAMAFQTLSPVISGAGFSEYLLFLATLAIGLTLYWTMQAVAPPPVHLIGLLALLLGVAGNGMIFFSGVDSAYVQVPLEGHVVGLASTILWLLVFVEVFIRWSRGADISTSTQPSA